MPDPAATSHQTYALDLSPSFLSFFGHTALLGDPKNNSKNSSPVKMAAWNSEVNVSLKFNQIWFRDRKFAS